MTLERISQGCAELKIRIPLDPGEFLAAHQRWERDIGARLKLQDPARYRLLSEEFSAIGRAYAQDGGASVQDLVFAYCKSVFEKKRDQIWGGSNVGAAFNDTRDELSGDNLSDELLGLTMRRLQGEAVQARQVPVPVGAPSRQLVTVPSTTKIASKLLAEPGAAVARAVSKRPVMAAGVAAGVFMGVITLSEIDDRMDRAAKVVHSMKLAKAKAGSQPRANTRASEWQSPQHAAIKSLLRTADSLNDRGDQQAAYENYLKVLDMEPDVRQRRWALGAIARLYMGIKRYATARDYIDTILQYEPRQPWALKMRDDLDRLLALPDAQ